MYNGDFTNNDSLESFFEDVKDRYVKHHPKGYNAYLNYILGCTHGRTYREFGVNQGASMAAAVLGGASVAEGFDLDLSNLAPHRHLFGEWASFREGNSLEVSPVEVDVLLLDTVHKPEHLREELAVHGPLARIIIVHDTMSKQKLRPVVEAFASDRTFVHYPAGCGHSVIS